MFSCEGERGGELCGTFRSPISVSSSESERMGFDLLPRLDGGCGGSLLGGGG